MEPAEPKSPTEPLDLRRKIDDTLAGRRPLDSSYPYFSPDYKLPFTHIGTERQLFLDNFMLDQLDGVRRVIVKPTRHPRPLIRWTDLPWEQSGFEGGAAGALRDPDDGKFKLWYWHPMSRDPFFPSTVLCYAESDDALNWTKPLSEMCLPYGEHKATNIVHTDTGAVAVVLNPRRDDPSRKFLMLYCPYAEAARRKQRIMSRVAASPDGLRWTVISDDSPRPHQHTSRIIWDESTRQWLAYSQYSHHWHHGPRTRQIGLQTSDDFIHWSPKEVVLSVDWEPNLPPDREFHEASIRKVGGLYILIVGECHTDPLWQVGGQGGNWRDQFFVTMALYTSRDGRRFSRAGGTEPWVEPGRPGDFDYGYACFTAAGAMVHDGRMVIPYLAIPHKQWVIGRIDNPVLAPDATRAAFEADYRRAVELGQDTESLKSARTAGGLILREDGWARLKPVREKGRVLTKQFVFEGNRLRLNADCRWGTIRAELLDPHHRPYEGFSAEACDPIHTRGRDTIWHDVTWRGNGDVSMLWNKPVRLVLHLDQASVYSFEFTHR